MDLTLQAIRRRQAAHNATWLTRCHAAGTPPAFDLPAFAAANALALLPLAFVLSIGALGVFIAANSEAILFSLIFVIPMVAVSLSAFVLLFLDDRKVLWRKRRDETAGIYASIDAICSRLGAKPVRLIGFEAGVGRPLRADCPRGARSGIVLGVPLVDALDDRPLAASIALAVARGRRFDPLESPLVRAALACDENLLRPFADWLAVGKRTVTLVLKPVILFCAWVFHAHRSLVIALLWRSSQRAAFLSDRDALAAADGRSLAAALRASLCGGLADELLEYVVDSGTDPAAVCAERARESLAARLASLDLAACDGNAFVPHPVTAERLAALERSAGSGADADFGALRAAAREAATEVFETAIEERRARERAERKANPPARL